MGVKNKDISKLIKLVMENKYNSAKKVLTKIVLGRTAKRINTEYQKLISK